MDPYETPAPQPAQQRAVSTTSMEAKDCDPAPLHFSGSSRSPADQLLERTVDLANRIAEKSPVALAMAKAAVKAAARTTLREGLDQEIDLFALCFSSEDKEEGVRAFLEKRKPNFQGR